MTAMNTKIGTPAPVAQSKPESKQNAKVALPKGAPTAVASPTPKLDRALLRAEAQARWQIRALEKSLEDVRMSREQIADQVQALGGPGASATIHGSSGAPIGLVKVRNGRESLDMDAIVTALAKATGQSEAMVVATFRKAGNPYLEFVEG